MQRVKPSIWRPSGTIGTAGLVVCLSMGVGCPVVYVPGEDVLSASGPILAEVLADGILSCEEHSARDQYNVCPVDRPEVGIELEGVVWSRDLFFGIIPNPIHLPLDCFRGESEELGLSSFQCCYDGEQLVDEGELAGSFDFVSPGVSLIRHYLYDMAPIDQCQGE